MPDPAAYDWLAKLAPSVLASMAGAWGIVKMWLARMQSDVLDHGTKITEHEKRLTVVEITSSQANASVGKIELKMDKLHERMDNLSGEVHELLGALKKRDRQ
jgi:hypothetical protein